MNRLFKQRLGKHLIHMSRYLKYVFNDFFVIALLFFVGGLGLAYSNFLKTLHFGTWWISLVLGIVTLISVQIGRLATLTQRPDYVFLLPKDRPMKSYLFQAFKYSDLNASIVQLVIWFLLLPLFRIQFHYGWPILISWLIIMLSLKFSWLMTSLNSAFQKRSWSTSSWLNRLWIPLIIIGVSLWVTPLFGLVMTIIWSVIQGILFDREASPVDWLRIIRTENHRMHDVYTVFNMFVDVPNFGSSICRRRYLNPLLGLIPLKHLNTYLYLYWHGFVRDKEFSNLYLRLLLIGLIIVVFLRGTILPVIMGLVFVYLIVFQVIPFYFHFENNAFVHIYPLNGMDQRQSFQKVLWFLTALVEILFAIGMAVSGHSLISVGILLILMTLEAYGMISGYLRRQIKNQD